jgi:hypothetical protein
MTAGELTRDLHVAVGKERILNTIWTRGRNPETSDFPRDHFASGKVMDIKKSDADHYVRSSNHPQDISNRNKGEITKRDLILTGTWDVLGSKD